MSGLPTREEARTTDTTLPSLLDLQGLCAREEDIVPIRSVHIQRILPFSQLHAFLQQWGRLAREHGFVDDASTAKQEEVAGYA